MDVKSDHKETQFHPNLLEAQAFRKAKLRFNFPLPYPQSWQRLQEPTREALLAEAIYQNPEQAPQTLATLSENDEIQARIIIKASKDWVLNTLAYLNLLKKGLGGAIPYSMKRSRNQLIDLLTFLERESLQQTSFIQIFERIISSEINMRPYCLLLKQVTTRLKKHTGLRDLYECLY